MRAAWRFQIYPRMSRRKCRKPSQNLWNMAVSIGIAMDGPKFPSESYPAILRHRLWILKILPSVSSKTPFIAWKVVKDRPEAKTCWRDKFGWGLSSFLIFLDIKVIEVLPNVCGIGFCSIFLLWFCCDFGYCQVAVANIWKLRSAMKGSWRTA